MATPVFPSTPVDGHLGRVQCSAIVNQAVMNIPVQGFCGLMFSFLLEKYPGVEWLGHRVDVCLTFFFDCQTDGTTPLTSVHFYVCKVCLRFLKVEQT